MRRTVPQNVSRLPSTRDRTPPLAGRHPRPRLGLGARPDRGCRRLRDRTPRRRGQGAGDRGGRSERLQLGGFRPNATITTPKESDVPKAARDRGRRVRARRRRAREPAEGLEARRCRPQAGLRCTTRSGSPGTSPSSTSPQGAPRRGVLGRRGDPRPRRPRGAAHAGGRTRASGDGLLHRPQAARQATRRGGWTTGLPRRGRGAGRLPRADRFPYAEGMFVTPNFISSDV